MTDRRTETDSLGPKQLPREAVWGIHTARALENFPITGVPLAHFPELVRALAMVKKAAALANRDLGTLDPGLAAAIATACDEINAGRHHEHFLVDMIQGGAGTSTNMNANEVIANLALKALGHAPGAYARLHPNDHVNRSQSTNDVYPTARSAWRCSRPAHRCAPSSSGWRTPSPSAAAPSRP
jgi:aspartate ammonia-lyase